MSLTQPQIILPEVHSSGLWKLKTPFNNLLAPDVWYTCIAVRKIEDFVSRGIDPYEEFYRKQSSISKEDYQDHVLAGMCIITVRNAAGDIKSFPSTYLESFPAGGGVPYHSLALVIELGALPVEKDLTTLMTRVQTVVKEEIGVQETAKLVNLAPKQLIDRETHKRYEAARTGIVKQPNTLQSRVLSAEAENAKLRKQITELEKYVISKAESN